MDNFDTEKFICEVESRPALWDYSCEEYSDREKKKRCWEELVALFLEKDDPTDIDRNELGKTLQRRWKSLRDCYSREIQRMAKLKSGSPASRKAYIYFKHLSFLQTVIKQKAIVTNAENEETHEEIVLQQPALGETGFSSRKRKNVSSIEQQLLNILQESIRKREQRDKLAEDDDDRLFLLSLLNPLKKLPEHLRFSVRLELLQVIQRAKLHASSSTTLSQLYSQSPISSPHHYSESLLHQHQCSHSGVTHHDCSQPTIQQSELYSSPSTSHSSIHDSQCTEQKLSVVQPQHMDHISGQDFIDSVVIPSPALTDSVSTEDKSEID